MPFDFQLGKPFRPFEQLMGVLPEASQEHIPMAYRVSLFARILISLAQVHNPSHANRTLCMMLTHRFWISTLWNLS